MTDKYCEIIKLKIPATNICVDEVKYTEKIYSHYMDYWKEVMSKFSNIEICYYSENTNVRFDWTSLHNKLIDKIENGISIKEFLMKDKEEQDKITKDYEKEEEYINVNCEVAFTTDIEFQNIKVARRHCSNILVKYLYDFYLVSNLAVPGSLDLRKAFIQVNENEEYELDICSYSFLSAWIYSLNNGWPNLSVLSLEDTWKWYMKLEISGKQIAINNMERALMSLFYIAEDSDIVQNKLVWLAVALEALYDTPNALISKLLKDRIILVLGEAHNKKLVNKRLNEFYNYRSKFVHGESKVFHPSLDTILEPKLFEYTSKYYDVIDFATAILLATIQVIISKDYKGLKFIENYTDN